MKATILKDSRHPANGSRITTFELTYPRFIHSELMTHRKFSRNSSSSRAIPVTKMLHDVATNPVIPIHWGANQSGMQAYTELSPEVAGLCEEAWLEARDRAVDTVKDLVGFNLHKQIANRLLEPWMWITVIVTSDQLGLANFFKLRCHEAAEPHINKLAWMMRELYVASEQLRTLRIGEWHLPFVEPEEDAAHALDSRASFIKKSVARCARGSYLQQSGDFSLEADGLLHDRMVEMGHWSPFEHQVQCVAESFDLHGNLCDGWTQYRKIFRGEAGVDGGEVQGAGEVSPGPE